LPKVNEDYVSQKKNQILDAALLVYAEKPVFAVTMQDIINRVGFSQGAIYRYFRDADDVLIAVYNRFFSTVDFSDSLGDILNASESPEQILRNLFSRLAEYCCETLKLYSKIRFELLMLYIAYPARGEKIKNALKVKQSNNLALEAVFSFIAEQVKRGYFKPIIPLDRIVSFAAVSYDGILYDGTFLKCYPENAELPPQIQFDVVELFNTLCDTVIIMLGGNLCGYH